MTETPERHPTYFESRNVYQRLADMLPLVDKLCFVAEHGEVVHLRQIVNDVIGEMFRFRSFTCALDSNAEIVDRLRSFAACRDADCALATEAADEIVRLRGIVSGVLDGTHVVVPKSLCDNFEANMREQAAALAERDELVCCDHPVGDDPAYVSCCGCPDVVWQGNDDLAAAIRALPIGCELRK